MSRYDTPRFSVTHLFGLKIEQPEAVVRMQLATTDALPPFDADHEAALALIRLANHVERVTRMHRAALYARIWSQQVARDLRWEAYDLATDYRTAPSRAALQIDLKNRL